MQFFSLFCAFFLMISASSLSAQSNSTAAQAAEEPRSDHTSSFLLPPSSFLENAVSVAEEPRSDHTSSFLLPPSFFLENAVSVAEEPRSGSSSQFPGLDFDANGDFVLCQITDMHEYYPVNEEAFRLLDENLGRVHPSLAIITGDNTWLFGNRESFPKVVERIVALLRKHNIRFAVTFGNHDSQKTGPELMDRQEQYNCFKELGGELFVDFDVPELYGVGNGAIALRQDGVDKFLLVIMDNANTPKIPWGEFLCDDAQIRWYEENASHLPCLWFQHIIVWDVYADGILQPTTLPQELQSLPLEEQIKRLPAGVVWCPMTQQFMRLSPEIQFTGELKEPPCPPPKNVYEDAEHTYQGRTLYQSWLKCGNMKGAFFGHDHMNTFVATDPKGITLGFTKAATLNSYNDGNPGLRFFRVHANGTYTTWQITAADLRQ